MRGKSTHAEPTKAQPGKGYQSRIGRISESQQAQVPRKAESRTAWNVPNPADPPLLRVLFKEANRRNHRLSDLAEALGCTYGYLAQIRSGRRGTTLSEKRILACAKYLRTAPINILILAGIVRVDHFVTPEQSRSLHENLMTIRDNPVCTAYFPESLFAAAPEVQQFVWNLFQECTDMGHEELRLMPMALALDDMQRAALCVADFEEEIAETRNESAAA